MARAQGPQTLNPLPVMETAREIFMTYKANLQHLPEVALVPFSISFLLMILEAVAGQASLASFVMFALAQIPPMVLFAVSWFRLVLLGAATLANDPLLRWSRRETRVLRNLIIIALIGTAFTAVLIQFGNPQQSASFLPGLLAMMASFLLLAVIMGLCFSLPAEAVDENYSLRQAWQDTRHCLLNLLGILIVVFLPAQITAMILINVIAAVQKTLGLVAPALILGGLLGYLIYGLWFTLLAVVFQRRTGWQPAGS